MKESAKQDLTPLIIDPENLYGYKDNISRIYTILAIRVCTKSGVYPMLGHKNNHGAYN